MTTKTASSFNVIFLPINFLKGGFINKLIFTSLIILASSSVSFGQTAVFLKFSGYYPPSLNTTIDGAPVTVETEVLAQADYVAQSPFCRSNYQRSTQEITLPVKTNSNHTGYAFSAARQLGPPCGYILVSLNFGLTVKGSGTLFGGVLMTQGPKNSKRERQLPAVASSLCSLDKYTDKYLDDKQANDSMVVICQEISASAATNDGGPSFYLPEDWSVQNFQFNFVK